MKSSEIDYPGHLIGLQPRRFPNWGAHQQPIKIFPLFWNKLARMGCILFVYLVYSNVYAIFHILNIIMMYCRFSTNKSI